MYYFIIQLTCLTFITATLAASLRDDDKINKKPDIEDFIDRLLLSDKFEQLADKIAERAADRVITLQQDSLNNEKKYKNRARLDDSPTHRTTTTQKTSSNETDNDNDSDKTPDEKKLDKHGKEISKKEKTDESEDEEMKKKPKIDTLAAMQKFSEFAQGELSLNYKHFTTHEKPLKTTTAYKKEKSKIDHVKRSHKNKAHKNKKDTKEVHKRSKSSGESKHNTEDSDLSIDENKEFNMNKKEHDINARKKGHPENRRHKSTESETQENERNKPDNKKTKFVKELTESSSSLDEEKYSTSDENDFTTIALPKQQSAERIIKKHKKILKSRSNKKSDIGTTEVATTGKATLKSTIAFGYVSSSSESESRENKVSNIADSEKLNERQGIKAEIPQNKMDKKNNVKDLKIKDEESFKHKVREVNGKLYTFADSAEYQEYHDKVSNLLQSVNEKKTKRDAVNRDLLDLVE